KKETVKTLTRTKQEEEQYRILSLCHQKKQRDILPKTDDDLWLYIKQFFGVEIPRVSVCEGHCSPFSFVADIFFERVTNAFGFANRASGKTRDVSIIHQLNSHFKPGCETASVGAIEHQAEKCYEYLLEYLHPVRGNYSDTVKSTRRGDTEYLSGSKVELLCGTLNCITGDSLMDIPRDLIKYPDGIPIKDLVGKKDVYVYGFNKDTKRVVLQKALDIRKTGENQPIYKTTYEWHNTGKYRQNNIKTTAEHLFLLKSGEYKKAEELKKGDRLEPFITSIAKRKSPIKRTLAVAEKLLQYHNIARRNQQDAKDNQYQKAGTSNLKQCKICNKIYRAKSKQSKYCSLKCMGIGRRHLNKNHKVISVEFCGYEDVYDLTSSVTHNFAVNNIFIHNSLNAPHPQKAFLDEVELVEWPIFQEFLNMVHSKEGIQAQNILTSTRKWLYGTVQRILDEGNFKHYIWCIFEVAKKCEKPTCAECMIITKGSQDNDTPRTFESVCKQRMRRSDGFISFGDIINRFLTLDRDTFEAQQECLKPGREGLVHKWFDEQKYIKSLPYNPDLPLYETIDWGGTNPFVCLWIQETHEPKILEIDELYIANIAPSTFADMVKARRQLMGYRVNETFGDPTGKDCILEFEKAGIKVKTTTADVGVSIQEVIKWGEDGKILTDPKCKNLINERRSYRWAEGKKDRNLPEAPIKESDHCVDAERIYCINRFLSRKKGVPSVRIIDFDE
ncbi:MAG: hypothetical protein KJ621_21075, partial [Proteobacteria bacterium]|nr:hypothetical protein [Pseudomonadota bacterium]